MATHSSAEKRNRQSIRRAARNKHWKTRVRNAIRAVRASAESGSEDRVQEFRDAEKLLRKAASKGVFRNKTVSRTVSRLHRLVERAR